MDSDLTNLATSQLFTLSGETVALSQSASLTPTKTVANGCRPSGSIIDLKYKIISLIGQGGMGAVYKAQHLLLHKELALKTFRNNDLTEECWQRFQREAQAIGKMMHPNIVQVFDFGVDENNIPYYTMELLSGESLADKLARDGRLPLNQSLDIFSQICQAMIVAHNKGIIHRDLKPANIFLSRSSDRTSGFIIKIVDFGLAGMVSQSISASGQQLTAAGTVFGSPLYMSPEQSLGLPLGHATDIYSCGCTFFETLSGKPPFRGKNAFATMLQHQRDNVPEVQADCQSEHLHRRINQLLHSMLAKKEDHRPPSFEQVLFELQTIAKDLRSEKQETPISGQNLQAKTLQAAAGVNDEKNPAKPLAIALMLAGILITLSAGAGGYYYFSAVHTGSIPKAPIQQKSGQGTMDPPAEQTVPRYVQSSSDSYETGRTYFFPKDKSLGKFKWYSPIEPKGYQKPPADNQAMGKNVVPPRGNTQLNAEKNLFLQPQLFDGFGPNDLEQLTLDQNYRWTDGHLKYIGRIKGLTYFQSDNNDFSDRAFDDLNQLTNLKVLSLKGSRLTGAKLSQLKCLEKLDILTIYDNKDVGPLLQSLARSKTIRCLQMESCNLDDHSLRLIANIKTLKSLELNQNPKIDNAALEKLAGLPHLKELSLYGSGISTGYDSILKKMPHLIKLKIDRKGWADSELDSLRKQLPLCDIENSYLNLSAAKISKEVKDNPLIEDVLGPADAR